MGMSKTISYAYTLIANAFTGGQVLQSTLPAGTGSAAGHYDSATARVQRMGKCKHRIRKECMGVSAAKVRKFSATASYFIDKYAHSAVFPPRYRLSPCPARPAEGPAFPKTGPHLCRQWAPVRATMGPTIAETGAHLSRRWAPVLGKARARRCRRTPSFCPILVGGSGRQKQKTGFFFGLSLAFSYTLLRQVRRRLGQAKAKNKFFLWLVTRLALTLHRL